VHALTDGQRRHEEGVGHGERAVSTRKWEIAPGVRRVDLTKRESEIPAYVTVSMRDNVYQPGSKSDNPAMPNDMVCHCLEGELQISQGPGKQFVAKTGDVWSCKKGMPEATENKGSTIAIMRVIDLIPPA
jgi:uncharacterized cupin superfamily protein